MADAKALETRFWKSLRSDMTMMLGLDGVDEGQTRPMTAQVEGESGPIWFFTAKDNTIVQNLHNGGRAIATFTSKGHDLFATVHGQLSVHNDRMVIDRLWNSFIAAWYEQGKSRPQVGLAATRSRTRRNLAQRKQPDRRHSSSART